MMILCKVNHHIFLIYTYYKKYWYNFSPQQLHFASLLWYRISNDNIEKTEMSKRACANIFPMQNKYDWLHFPYPDTKNPFNHQECIHGGWKKLILLIIYHLFYFLRCFVYSKVTPGYLSDDGISPYFHYQKKSFVE